MDTPWLKFIVWYYLSCMSKNKSFPAAQIDGSLLSFQSNLPQRILLVNRDPYVCHLYADVLIRHGYDVNAAEDGAAGWKELQANPYHLLITENDLPKISGAQLIRKVRAARLDVSVVMVASKLSAREQAGSPSLQPGATLLKPMPGAALLDTVKTALRASARSRDPITPPPCLQGQLTADGGPLKPDATWTSTVKNC